MLKFDYPEDYTGNNLNHRIIGEKRKLTDPTSRVVTLDYGSFFAESVVVRNVATGRPLILGRDYACVELDTLATSRSGKQVSTVIKVQNQQVEDVEIDYIFVGGQHMSGLHLIKELKKIYPNGLEPRYHFDSVLNKPETYKAKEHAMHVKSLYGFDGVDKSIADMIAALGFKDQRQLNVTFAKITERLAQLNIELEDFIADTQERLDQAFEDFRVQDNEFIFTNTKDNPAIKRGYGNWVLVNNIILKGDRGDAAYAVGQDSVISLGTKQMLTNCYVWKNQASSKTPTYTITSVAHAGLPSTQRNEDQDIVINIATTNLAAGTKLSWVVIDNVTKEPISPEKLYGTHLGDVTLDAQGKAQVTLRFKPNTNTPTANRSYSFRLLRTVNTLFNFTVIDSSLEKRIELFFTVDAQGNHPIKNVNENQEFFLQLRYIGNWQRGEVVQLDWSTSAIKLERITTPNGNIAPTSVVVPSSPSETYALKINADSLTDRTVMLIVYALAQGSDVISSVTPYASLEVNDTSKFGYANITFDDISTAKTTVARIDEDVTFDIVINTNLPNTELNLIYNTTKPISDFQGLLSTVITNASGRAVIRAKTISDFLTNIGAQSLTVQAEANGKSIGYNTLFINDTSKTPNYQVFFSRDNISQVITEVNEGEKFFLNIKVDNWQAGANAPSLEFNYTLNEVSNTQLDALKARLVSTFYPAMLFAQSSSTYSEVTWVNGNTLRFEFTAIADKLVKGDTKLGVMVKQSNQSQFDKVAYLSIRDTSIPTVVGSWSSSSSVLTPITQVDEMQSNGLNQRCYLWIDVDGDGGSFGDITLKSNSVNGEDLVTVFPRTIKMSDGISRHILTVDAKADFIAEGNKSLFVAGTYKNSRGQDVELFRSTITLVDNSILTALTASTSTSASTVTPASGFSEWAPFYTHFDFPAFAFDTQIEWSANFTNNPSNLDQLAEASSVMEVARNTAKSVLTLTPIKDRLKDGETTFTLNYRRKIKSTGQYITSQKTLTGIKILDDSLPMAVVVKAYTNAARTVLAPTFVDEGTKLYLRATVSNPDRDYAVCFGVADATAKQFLIGNVTVNGLSTANVPGRILIDDRKIVAIVPATPGASSVNVDAEMTVVADRTTRPTNVYNDYAVRIEARAYDNSTNQYPVGTVAAFSSAFSESDIVPIGINDTSKSAIYTVNSAISTNEDAVFEMTLNVIDGTVGDVFYPIWDGGTVAANRFELMGMGEEQLLATSSMSLTWRFKIKGDYKTTGELRAVIGFMNKTIGQKVINRSINVADTSLPPNIFAYVTNTTDPTIFPTGYIAEGATTDGIVIYSTNAQFKAGDQLLVEYVGGRAKDQFTTTLFKTHTLTAANIIVPIRLPYDRKTNTAAENVLTVKITHLASGVVANISFDIFDISKTPTITGVQWVNPSNNAVISSVREGEKARLRVTTTGGTHAFGLTLANDGGRSIGRLNSNDYGVTRTHTTDNNVLLWNFDVKLDNLSNVGNETKLRVRLTSPDAGVTLNQVYELPIVDNSFNTTVDFKVVKNDGSTTAVSYLEEGVSYKLIAGTAAPSDSEYYTLKWGHNTHYFTGAASNYERTEVSDGNYIDFPVITFTLNDVNRTASDKLWFKATVNLGSQGTEIAAFNLPVIDSKVPLVTAKITSLADINTAISTADEGSTVKLVVDPNLFTGVNWSYGTNHRIKWTVVNSGDESATVDRFNNTTGYITQASLSNFNGGYGFQTNLGILANEITNSTNNSIKVILVEEYVVGGVTHYIRMGQTNTLTIRDTSPNPVLTDVFFSKSGDVNNATSVTTFNEGDTFYIHGRATGLRADSADAVLSLAYSGTSSAADFDQARATSLTMKLVNATTREYRGVVGPYTIKEDLMEG